MSQADSNKDQRVIEWLESRLADAEFEVALLKQRLSESNAIRKNLDNELKRLKGQRVDSDMNARGNED